MSEAALCGCVAAAAAALWALGAGSLVVATLPRDRREYNVAPAAGMVLGVFATAAWYVVAMCGMR